MCTDVCLGELCAPCTYRGLKKTLGSLELELQVVVSALCGWQEPNLGLLQE